jgi:hypothetical protein
MSEEINRQPLLDTQQNHLGTLLNISASIDAKALGLLAATVAALIFIGQANFALEWWQWPLLVGPFFVSLAYNVLAVRPSGYISAAIDIDKDPEYLAMDQETLVLQLLSNTQKAIAHNSRLNKIRWRYCVKAFVAALVGTLVLILTSAVQ